MRSPPSRHRLNTERRLIPDEHLTGREAGPSNNKRGQDMKMRKTDTAKATRAATPAGRYLEIWCTPEHLSHVVATGAQGMHSQLASFAIVTQPARRSLTRPNTYIYKRIYIYKRLAAPFHLLGAISSRESCTPELSGDGCGG